MHLEELKCDISEILENKVDMKTLLQKWELSSRGFRSHVAAKIEAKTLYEKGMYFY